MAYSKRSREPRVYLSYSAADTPQARRLADSLRAAGLEVWFDEWQLRPDDSIQSRVDNAIESSDVIVVLLSPNAVRSHWFSHELAHLLADQLRDRAVTLIPALIATTEVPESLRWRKIVDLTKNFDAGVRKLQAQIEAVPRIDFAQLDPREFERLVQELLGRLGFTIDDRPVHSHWGWDFHATFASKDPFGALLRETWVVEVKHYGEERVSVAALRQMLEYVASGSRGTRGVIITSAQLTSVARDFLADTTEKTGQVLRVVDRAELTQLVARYPNLVKKYFPKTLSGEA